MKLIKKYLESGKVDPIKQAQKENYIDWKAVAKMIQPEMLYKDLPYMAEDTLAYIDQWLEDKGVPELQRNVILGNIIVETGGRPSLPSGTAGKLKLNVRDATYFGLLLWSKDRLKKRIGGMPGLMNLLEKIYKEIYSPATWTKGFDIEGFNDDKEAFKTFWNPDSSTHLVPAEYRLKKNSRNKASLAFVGGYVRPGSLKFANVLRATAAKAVELYRDRNKMDEKQIIKDLMSKGYTREAAIAWVKEFKEKYPITSNPIENNVVIQQALPTEK